jgi:hypothetical protein|tara:strand:+ start:137 stop:352 length:216 start_codon:yes stop_codon:yes gene_type:complete
MRAKTHVVYDIKSEKFKYLHREENKIKNKVDIDVLNKRLNQVKKSNIHSNLRMIGLTFFVVLSFGFISYYF